MKEFLLISGIYWLGLISPGPDFAMVVRNSLVYSRKTGILAAVGLGLGIATHITYSLLGIGLVISRSIMLFNTIKYLGAIYLIYIGIKSLLSKKETKQEISNELKEEFEGEASAKDLSTFSAIKMGYLTNILNPKATLFMLALFTQVISPDTVVGVKVLLGIEMAFSTFLWFAFVAIILTHKSINRHFQGVKHYFEKVFGAILVGLGIKVALGSHK